ncbi:zinc finger protein 830 [Glossina fuscipes fuscipes]
MEKLKGRIDQKDLRKLMAERKSNLNKSNAEKINSPLAKYDSKGNLSCIICRSSIKSSTLWKVHINSKLHKQNVEEAKMLKTQIVNTAKDMTQQRLIRLESSISTLHTKPRGLEKPKKEVILKTKTEKISEKATMSIEAASENTLPELFFDEPANKKDLKDPHDEEWERFQREIKEETITSNVIIAGEQNEATVDRQIEEIDEQIQHWAKVLDLEEKVEKMNKINKAKQDLSSVNSSSGETSSEAEDDDTLDELLNWRCKSFK